MKKKEPDKKTEELEVIKNDEDDNVVPFELIQGGRTALAGLPPNTQDWLDELPVGTTFTCGNKLNADFIEPEYVILDKVTGRVLLRLERPGNKTELWVNTARFSQQHYLGYILGNTDYYD